MDEQEPGCTGPHPSPVPGGGWARGGVASDLKVVVLGQDAPGWRSHGPVKVLWHLEFRPGTHLSPVCLPASVSSWLGCSFLPSFLGGFLEPSTLAELRKKVCVGIPFVGPMS